MYVYGTYNDNKHPRDERFFILQKFLTEVWMRDTLGHQLLADPVHTLMPGAAMDHAFALASSYTSLLVTIFDRGEPRLPFHLITPKGESIGLDAWPDGYSVRSGSTETARFIEVTLPTDDPRRIRGRWSLRVENNTPKQSTFGYLIGAESQFRMKVDVRPRVIMVDQTVLASAELIEFDLPVTGCRLVLTVTNPVGVVVHEIELLDDGQHEDGAAEDGVYATRVLIAKPWGFYRFHFRAERSTRQGLAEVREAEIFRFVGDESHSIEPETRSPPDGLAVVVSDLAVVASDLAKAVRAMSLIALGVIIAATLALVASLIVIR